MLKNIKLILILVISTNLTACAHSQKNPRPSHAPPSYSMNARYLTVQSALTDLKKTIRASITQTEPHYKNRGGSLETGAHTSFIGNYDWHSAVHGHWAALTLAKATQDEELKNFTLARLTPSILKAERSYLLTQPAFEMPYGRAWLLLLLKELETLTEVKKNPNWIKNTKDFRRETEKDILNWLKNTSFPDAPNAPRSYPAQQKFRGDHYSWLLTYAFLELSRSEDPWINNALKLLKKTKIEPYRAEIIKNQSLPFDFLEPSSLLALIDELQGVKSNYNCDRAPLPDAITRENAHRPGAYIADQWPCALQSKSQTRFESKTLALLNRPDLWQEDFDQVGHWVPQFIWMGIWLTQIKNK